MHEQSEGKGTPEGETNVYGRATLQAGQPLPLLYGFEKSVYPTIDEAEKAATLRSILEGRWGRGGAYDPTTLEYLRPLPIQPQAQSSGLMQLLKILMSIRQGMTASR
jgi:hypothetical protein